MLKHLFEKSYTLEEYLQMVRAKEEKQRTRNELRTIGAEEVIAKRILANQGLKKMFSFVAGSFMYLQSSVVKAASKTDEAMKKIDIAGTTLLGVVRTIGYWICIIMCIIEILRCLANGDTKEIGKIIMKYLLAFGAFFLLPWLFDLLRAVFS